MSDLLLATFNHYMGGNFSPAEVGTYLNRIRVLPVPERIALDDWRAHVPMQLLEAWSELPAAEKIAIFVMALSATHYYECTIGPEEPAMN